MSGYDPSLAGGQSEVARLRRQIEAEYLAMQRGLYGLAFGRARHQVIAFHLRRADRLAARLAGYVGEAMALQTLCQLYDEVLNQEVSDALSSSRPSS
ncbi:hypothetical protein [Thermogemmatispora sp.]|uniref:hypothetical protein n=1 Tax=Thermogemmatispora sp. TaxID=1968838 RepID=UPI0035E43BF6